MKNFLYFFIALLLTACMQNNAVNEAENPTEILGLQFSDVGNYSIYVHHPHIKDLDISNSTSNMRWPGSNSITFARLVPDIYQNFDELLHSICSTDRLDGRPNPFDVLFKKSISGYEIWKIQKNCSGDDNIYIPPRYIQYLVMKDDDVFVVRIDDEAEDDDMERFEELILSIQ